MNKKIVMLVMCAMFSMGPTHDIQAKKEKKIKVKKVVKGGIKSLIGIGLIALALKKQVQLKAFGFNLYNEKSPNIRKFGLGLLGGLVLYHGASDIAEGFHV